MWRLEHQRFPGAGWFGEPNVRRKNSKKIRRFITKCFLRVLVSR